MNEQLALAHAPPAIHRNEGAAIGFPGVVQHPQLALTTDEVHPASLLPKHVLSKRILVSNNWLAHQVRALAKTLSA
jgi:hypothetical protein